MRKVKARRERAAPALLLGATLAKDMTGNRAAHLRFEEGPCAGMTTADSQDPIPDRKLRCTSTTYGGGGPTDVDATVFTYPTDGLGESAVGVVKESKLVGPGRCCSPLHSQNAEPPFLELHGIL